MAAASHIMPEAAAMKKRTCANSPRKLIMLVTQSRAAATYKRRRLTPELALRSHRRRMGR